jgi:hypothetical protein
MVDMGACYYLGSKEKALVWFLESALEQADLALLILHVVKVNGVIRKPASLGAPKLRSAW